MKSLTSIFLILFLISSCLTGFGCTAGKNRSVGTSHNADDQSDELSKLLYKAKEISFLKSLIVWKNNDVIVEEYLKGGRAGQPNDIRSAAKSILSAVLGCAIKDGYIDGIDQKVIGFFPEYRSDQLDSRVYDLRIRHLITMRSGFDIKESGKVYQQLYESNNWIEHILHLPFQSDPGKKFNYHSFNTHLLSAIITKATGMSTMQYATQALFTPLGITKILWEKDPNGIYIGGWGLSMTARDMLKLGILYLNNGLYGKEQLISTEWVNSSTTEESGMIGTYYSGWNKSYGYGYLWWVKRLNDEIDIPFAMGHGGQRIAIIKKANAVIVTQAEPNPKPPKSSYKRHRLIDSLLFEDFSPFLLNGS